MSSDFQLNSELLQLIRNEAEEVDIIVIAAEGAVFCCHSTVLASRSKYFEQYLREHPHTLQLDLPVNEVITRVLLHFMYSSRLPTIDAQNVYDLLRASERLIIKEVSNHCYEYLHRNVGLLPMRHFESFSTWCNEEQPYNSDLSNFILAYFEICIRTDQSFLQVPVHHWKNILTHYRSRWIPYENEIFLVIALIRWARVAEIRKRYFEELMDMVDFSRVPTEWLNCLRTTYANDWDIERQGWKAMIIKCLPLFNFDAMYNVVIAPAPLIPNQPLKSECGLRLLLGYHAELKKRSQSQNDAFETYTLLSKVGHFWPCSYKFERPSRIFRKGKPAIMASAVVDDRLYCLEYDTKHLWPQFNAYNTLDAISNGFGRIALARPPCQFSRRPSMSGFSNRPDEMYLLVNDEPDSSHYKFAQSLCPGKRTEKAKGQCCFYYLRSVNNWYITPFRRHDFRSSCLVAGDNLTYLIGGYQDAQVGGSLGSDAGRYVQAYEYRLPSWEKLPMTTHSYHSSRYRNSNYATGCSLNGEIFVCDLVHTEVYDPKAGKWREIPQPQQRMLEKPDTWRKLIALEEDKLLLRFYQENSNIVREEYDPSRGSWDVSMLHINVFAGSYINDIFFSHNNYTPRVYSYW